MKTRRFLVIEIPLDVAGGESARDLSVAADALRHALKLVRGFGRAPAMVYDLHDPEGRVVGTLRTRKRSTR